MNNFTNYPPEEVYLEIGKRIAAARTALGITQAELAEAVSLSRTSVTNIEGGRQKILVHLLLQIATLLRVDIAELLPKVESNTSRLNDIKSLEKLDKAERAFIEKALMAESGEEIP